MPPELSFFRTQVWKVNLTSALKRSKISLESLKNEVNQFEVIDKQGQKWSRNSYPGGYTSFGSINPIHRFSSIWDQLRECIDLEVGKFGKALGHPIWIKKLPIEMNSSWVNRMGQHCHHGWHFHPHAVISGTFYLSELPKDTFFRIEDPRLPLMMNSPSMRADGDPTKAFASIATQAGDLLLFESWLRHEVPKNLTKENRYSFSFNYQWNR